MNKTHFPNSNYPQLPAEMNTTTNSNGHSEQRQTTAAPPSYDQATGTITSGASYVVGPPPGAQTQMPMPYQQQYISSSTCMYTPQQSAAPPTITQQPVVIIQQQMFPLGPEPVYITCPNCRIQKLTRIEYEPSTRTHLMAGLLCILGLWCCVCLPYCAGSCMNANHYCGNCNKFLGTYGNGL